MTHLPCVETVPSLILEERTNLVGHLLRFPSLFAIARPCLDPHLFYEADEAHLRVTWGAAIHAVTTHGPGLLSTPPAHVDNVIRMAALAYAESHPGEMTQEFFPQLTEFFEWAFAPAATNELSESFGLNLLKRFLRERAVVEELRSAIHDAGEQSITNLPQILKEAAERDAVIQQLGGGGRTLADDWAGFQAYLQTTRGRTIIGLRTGMPQLDDRTLGLRGLIALGAMPGLGKTAFALQLGLNVVTHNDDAVLLFVSLEMSRNDLYTRVLCNRAGLDWKTVVLGSPSLRGQHDGPWHTLQDSARLTQAEADLQGGGLGSRIAVLDGQALGAEFTAGGVLDHLARLKEAVHATRALVVVDYLQLLPAAGLADLDADRHRVQFLKELLDGTRTPANPAGDCVLTISEMRKPSGNGRWAGGLADLMGSARLPYALDAAVVFQGMEKTEEFQKYDWSPVDVMSPGATAFAAAEVAPIALRLVKGRDGFRHGTIGLAFEYTRARFTEVDCVADDPGFGAVTPVPAASPAASPDDYDPHEV